MHTTKNLIAALLCGAMLLSAPGSAAGAAARGRRTAAAKTAPAAQARTGTRTAPQPAGAFFAQGPLLPGCPPFGNAAAQPAARAPAAIAASSPAARTHRPRVALTPAERDRAERVVMSSCGEVGNPAMAMANAQVILDRTASGRFGGNIDAVLTAPGQFEKPWKGTVNAMVREAVAEVFDGGKRVTAVPIYYYINPYLAAVDPAVWRRDKRYVRTIGTGRLIHQYWTDR